MPCKSERNVAQATVLWATKCIMQNNDNLLFLLLKELYFLGNYFLEF